MLTTSNYHPNHKISALIRIDPAAASKQLLDVLESKGMHKGEAAKAIGCAHSTLLAWIKQLNLFDKIAKLETTAIEKGWHHGRKGGRPEGSTVANGAAPRTVAAKTTKPIKPKAEKKARGSAVRKKRTRTS